MKLPREIIDISADDETPLRVLLRKCLVLAATLKNDELKLWAEKELNGYGQDEELPKYRVISVFSKGNFRGPFGASITNQPLPAGLLKEEHRKIALTHDLRDPIASYEHLLEQSKDNDKGNFVAAWPPDLIRHYQHKFIEHYGLVGAWQEVPSGALAALCDTVRNRILSFALEMDDALAEVNDDPAALKREEVNQHVTNIIFGGNNVLAARAERFGQVGTVEVEKGNIAALLNTIRDVGLADPELDQLRAAIEQDKAEASDQSGIGPKTSSWLSRVLARVGKESLKVSVDVARATITKALLSYFGIG